MFFGVLNGRRRPLLAHLPLLRGRGGRRRRGRLGRRLNGCLHFGKGLLDVLHCARNLGVCVLVGEPQLHVGGACVKCARAHRARGAMRTRTSIDLASALSISTCFCGSSMSSMVLRADSILSATKPGFWVTKSSSALRAFLASFSAAVLLASAAASVGGVGCARCKGGGLWRK
jgi:hypothetical protein